MACSQRAPDLARALARLVGELHQDAAAIDVVPHAPHVAGALQAVEHGGDGAAGEAALARQLPGGQAAVLVEDVERAAVAAVDAEERDGRVVERLLRVLVPADGQDELADQRLALFS